MKKVVADPKNLDTVPWVKDCTTCLAFSSSPNPGLGTWLAAVGNHMTKDHRILLVMP